MATNQPQWPREWLMTDERIGDRLWQAIEALPDGKAGVVFRLYALAAGERADLAQRVAAVCRERGLMLAIGGNADLARLLDARLVHNPVEDPGLLPMSRSAHSFEEAQEAWRSGARLIFLSPLFATRSHPEKAPLARAESLKVVAASPVPVIALGGMNRERFAKLQQDGFYGWAGIDAWLSD
jgi:thiamine-phosphate pyrophosphorylase